MILPVSPPSAATTWYGIKWVSKKARTAAALLPSVASAALHAGSHNACFAGAATSALQPTRKAGHAACTSSAFHPGSSLHGTGR